MGMSLQKGHYLPQLVVAERPSALVQICLLLQMRTEGWFWALSMESGLHEKSSFAIYHLCDMDVRLHFCINQLL